MQYQKHRGCIVNTILGQLSIVLGEPLNIKENKDEQHFQNNKDGDDDNNYNADDDNDADDNAERDSINGQKK